MTKERIIRGLQEIDSICGQSMDESSSWIGEVLHGAVRLLEQEPSGDVISRQAVIDALYDIEVIKYRIDIENVIKALPPVKPQPCKDAISRQALLDDFGFSEKTRKYGGDHSGYNTMMLYEIQDVIESQPPI